MWSAGAAGLLTSCSCWHEIQDRKTATLSDELVTFEPPWLEALLRLAVEEA